MNLKRFEISLVYPELIQDLRELSLPILLIIVVEGEFRSKLNQIIIKRPAAHGLGDGGGMIIGSELIADGAMHPSPGDPLMELPPGESFRQLRKSAPQSKCQFVPYL